MDNISFFTFCSSSKKDPPAKWDSFEKKNCLILMHLGGKGGYGEGDGVGGRCRRFALRRSK